MPVDPQINAIHGDSLRALSKLSVTTKGER